MKTITKIIPRYAETDKMGIIHHSVYPIWYEVGRTEFCKEIGIPYHEIEKRGITQALVSLRCDYIYPTRYGDELTIVTKVKTCTKVKLEFEYEIYNQDNVLVNVGTTLLAWLNNNLKPLNISKEHNDIYQVLLKTLEE